MKKNILLSLCIIFTSNSVFASDRIITIGGAITEIIYALGAEDKLVGSDTTSYYPPAASALPKVGYMRTLSTEGVLSLNPDLIILTDEAGPPTVIEQLKQTGVEILQVRAARSMDDIFDNISQISKKLDINSKNLTESIKQDTALLEKALKESKPVKAMFVLQVGMGGPMVAGINTAASSIIYMAGANNVVFDYEGYKPLTPEAAIALNPDFLITTNRSVSMAGGLANFQNTPGIKQTSAAMSGKIIAMDDLLLIGFGPRTAKAAFQLSNGFGAK